MKINKLIEEAPQRHAERVARWKADPQVNDMMRSTAPDRIWFTKIGKDILPNSERVTAEDVEYVRADLARAQLAEALAVPEVAVAIEEMDWALPILKRHLKHPNDEGALASFEAALDAQRTALDEAEARAEKEEVEATFFQSEVKLRNRIPATSDAMAEILRDKEKAEAERDTANALLREAQLMINPKSSMAAWFWDTAVEAHLGAKP